jgi:VIT1/CCC1 family predicted Fe2+/Mn2+ transporter
MSSGVALVLGIANVLADGFSMAAGNFLRARSDQQLLEQFRRMEETHIDRIPEGEREEVRQIFQAKGFSGDVLEQIVQVITEDRQQWVNTMLTEEWGLRLNLPSPFWAGAATMSAYVLAGLVPLVPLVFAINQAANASFPLSSLLTGATFLAIGIARGRTLGQPPLWSGLETRFIGGSAAAVAYVVGRLLHDFAGA